MYCAGCTCAHIHPTCGNSFGKLVGGGFSPKTLFHTVGVSFPCLIAVTLPRASDHVRQPPPPPLCSVLLPYTNAHMCVSYTRFSRVNLATITLTVAFLRLFQT